MKTRLFVAIAATIMFSSCQKDFSAEYGVISLSNNSTTNIESFNCKASAYFPICSGSEYHYTDTRGALATGTTLGVPNNFTLANMGDTIIEAKTYQKIKGENNQIIYYSITNGALIQISINQIDQNTTSNYKTILVKSDVPAGSTWTDVNNLPGNVQESITNKIISKGISRTVSNKLYNEVMYISQTLTSSAYNNGNTPYMHADLYYAKGVGLIESISYSDLNNGSILNHHKLLSALLQ
jgi:hypothetical protein